MADNSENYSNSVSKRTKIFTYGTLKQGFHNHTLMASLISNSKASFIGTHQTQHLYPLVCGPHGIPYLINKVGSGHSVKGELYCVTPDGLDSLDFLEGIEYGHYERLPIRVVEYLDGAVPIEAEAYFAHRSFAEALWDKNGREGLCEFSEREARMYMKREDRPLQGRNILDDIQLFLDSTSGH